MNGNSSEDQTKTASPDVLAKRIESKFKFALKELTFLAREMKPRRRTK
jgi:hypothetical protein